MKKFILSLVSLAAMVSACNTVMIEQPDQCGELSVSLFDEPGVEVVTKAPEALSPTDDEASKYTVRIFNASDEKLYEATYKAFETQTLALGSYYVTAENCSEAAAETGNGTMRLFGKSDNVTLSADALTGTATVNCTVTNAKVSVKFDESVKDKFSGLQVTLSGGTTRTKAITVAQTATDVVTETWFNPSALTYTISGTFTGSGMSKDVSISDDIELKAKNNILLVVKVNLENGQLVPAVTIDTELDNLVEEDATFNPYN